MRLSVAVATLLAGALLTPQASFASQDRACIARVLHSEELPFALSGHWLVKVSLEVTPPNGAVYEINLHDTMPWQAPPPRQGQRFRLQCDPAKPAGLHLLY
jgi:hypothetical protein